MSGPSSVGLYDPVAITLAIEAGTETAGFDGELRFARPGLEFSGVVHRTVAPSGGRVRTLGTIERPAGVVFGAHSCTTPACRTENGAGSGTLATIELFAAQPGRHEVLLGDLNLVRGDGSRIPATFGRRSLVIDVAGGGAVRTAPPATTRAAANAGAGRPADVNGDGRVDRGDVREAEYGWITGAESPERCGREWCVGISELQRRSGNSDEQLETARISTTTTAAGSEPAPAVTVNSLGDEADASSSDGVCKTSKNTCTLRAAIGHANARTGPDVIAFDIPGTGPFTIRPATRLPAITDLSGPVTIDGYTQPGSSPNAATAGSNAVIQIEIRGTGPTGIDGFFVTSPGNVFRGISVYNTRRAIWLYGADAHHNVVIGSFVGTNAAGTFTMTGVTSGSSGVHIQNGAQDNIVGRPALADRNVLSGNPHHGVAMYDYLTSRNIVHNNVIGLTPAGTARLGNRSHGVDINTFASDNVVGGTGEGERNLIGGNIETGVEISHGTGTVRNKAIGNWIGTSPDGLSAPAHAAHGKAALRLEGAANCKTCAPDIAYNSALDNVIVGGAGGILVDKGAHHSTIAGNRVGLTVNGSPGRNAYYGVQIEHGSEDNVVGPGNEVAYNQTGVVLLSPGTQPSEPTPSRTWRNKITSNSIYENEGLGIDIEPVGSVNLNDDGDVDDGANTMLNFPVLTASSSQVTARACGGCTVELFVADGAAFGYGEGRQLVGSAVADGSGSAVFSVGTSLHDKVVTATATDASGNTSEFGRNVTVPASSGSNKAPVADFTSSCTELSCSFNGSSSSDPDGTIASWAWNFGDGATGTGATPSHTYAAGGSYSVSLTVTDNDGATGTTSRTVTVTAPVSNTVASDTFTRSVTGGWGAATTGGTWTVTSGAGADYSVDGSAGAIRIAAGASRAAYLDAAAARDVDASLVLWTDKTPAGGSWGHTVSQVVRKTAANTQYRVRLRIGTDGRIFLAATRLNGSYTEESIGSEVSTGLVHSPNTKYRLRVRATGANPTTINAKVWADGSPEPSPWHLTVTDATSALQGSGSTGVHTFVSSAATNGPITLRVDDYEVLNVG